jgi:dethiobiotin synthetase
MAEVRGWFITGTDTGVGKTVVSLALMQLLQQRGDSVLGMKPVASGCEHTPAGLRNDDALRLQQQSSLQLDYALVNPYAFEPAIAPHLAAAAAGVRIEPAVIAAACARLAAQARYVVVEGVGGWLVPLNETDLLADLAARLGLPVILVVGIRLGCLNHALLTVESIERSGQQLAGWVANCQQATDAITRGNIVTLEARIGAPLLGVMPWQPGQDADFMAPHLSLPHPGA